MGKIKYKREQFDNSRKFIVLKEMLFASKTYLPGDNFPLDKKDKKACTRARQLYQMRKLDYKDNYTQADIRQIKKEYKIKFGKEKPKSKQVVTSTTTTTSTSSTSSTTTTTTV